MDSWNVDQRNTAAVMQLRADTRRRLAELYHSPAPGSQVAQLLQQYPNADLLEDRVFQRCQTNQQANGASFDRLYRGIVSKLEDALMGQLTQQQQQIQRMRVDARRTLAELYRDPALTSQVNHLLSRYPSSDQLEARVFQRCLASHQSTGASLDPLYRYIIIQLEYTLTGRLPREL